MTFSLRAGRLLRADGPLSRLRALLEAARACELERLLSLAGGHDGQRVRIGGVARPHRAAFAAPVTQAPALVARVVGRPGAGSGVLGSLLPVAVDRTVGVDFVLDTPWGTAWVEVDGAILVAPLTGWYHDRKAQGPGLPVGAGAWAEAILTPGARVTVAATLTWQLATDAEARDRDLRVRAVLRGDDQGPLVIDGGPAEPYRQLSAGFRHAVPMPPV